jgi:hypothetical protein
MPHPGGSDEAAGAAPLRCTGCGGVVDGTRQTRTGCSVGHYKLHTGRTVEATLRRGDCEAPLAYRRVLEPVEVVSCPACFATPAMRRRWATFGDGEPVAT